MQRDLARPVLPAPASVICWKAEICLDLCCASTPELYPSWQYGGQIVPMAREQELALKYIPDKGFRVLGVVKRRAVPRSMWIGVSTLVDSPGFQVAKIALQRY